jgi:hypothetical protein
VTATGVLVEFVGPTRAVLHSFIEDRDHVIDVAAVSNDEILDEER